MKTILIALLSAVILSSSSVFSQGQLKIGHVNVVEIMHSLPEKDSAQKVLEKETKDVESVYEELTVEYNKLYEEYQKGLTVYSELVKKTRETELMDKQKRIAGFEQDASAMLQKRNTELLQPIIDRIMKAIDMVATENSFTYIIDLSKGSVVFTSKESLDINPLVLGVLMPGKP
jgi:outer membrane protein